MRRMSMALLGCLATIQAAQASQSQDAETSTYPETSLASNIVGRIATGWERYDSPRDDYLSPQEFSAWMNDLRAENGKGPADETIMQLAFRVADVDKDMMISRDELTAFMMSRNLARSTAVRQASDP